MVLLLVAAISIENNGVFVVIFMAALHGLFLGFRYVYWLL